MTTHGAWEVKCNAAVLPEKVEIFSLLGNFKADVGIFLKEVITQSESTSENLLLVPFELHNHTNDTWRICC